MNRAAFLLSVCLLATASWADEGTRRPNAVEGGDSRFPKHRFVTWDPRLQDEWPCFSPDSQSLLFSRTTDGKTWSLFTVPVSGGKPRPFPDNAPLSGTRANWSPKHDVIMFNGSAPAGGFNLTRINGDGSGLRLVQCAGLSAKMSYPSWYPDGKAVAVVEFSAREGSAIKRIDLEQGTVDTLTDLPTHWAGVPRVSPDGRRIVLGRQEHRGQSYNQYQNQIWILNRDGGLNRLDAKRGWAPCWSPDGKWLAFASDRNSDAGLSAIFVAFPDGATIRQMTPPELNAGHPTWSPDGKLIAFYAQQSVDNKARGLAVLEVPLDLQPNLSAAASVPNSDGALQRPAADNGTDSIRPYVKNPRYWQYKGQPVMLLGGSKTDHIFLLDELEEHLDEIAAVGANYVRCTMSQREGLDLKLHKRLADGKFDLEQWNEGYWKRFADCLKWCGERDIVIQIEVWDRFDYATQYWETSPWNPQNNINYDYVQSGFAKQYTNQQLYADAHPFFHTVKGTSHYISRYDLIRKHQEAFVTKMLSYSLKYPNVLYCMNNETSSEAGWGRFWIDFIKAKAAEKGVTVCTTDMFDDAFEGDKAKHTPLLFNDPEHYLFADISQVNSRNFDERHWDRLQWLLQQMNKHPRPSNHTKIYGSGYKTFGTGGPEDGIERFWRNILGGSASARFHRPDSGNGLNDMAKASIQAARLLESEIKFWDVAPHMELLSDRTPNEAYLAAKPGQHYALYFTNGGSVKLDLSRAPGTFNITWISVSMGRTVESSQLGGYRLMDKTIEGGRVVTLAAPYKGGWVAALVKK